MYNVYSLDLDKTSFIITNEIIIFNNDINTIMSNEFPESSGIVKLTPNVLTIRNNMPFVVHNELQHRRPYFLVFYANWCGHCKTLSPIMEALAQKYRQMNMHKPVAAIDCAEHNLGSSFQNIVEGYPTIFSVNGNSCKRYSGPRSVEAFDNHLNERAAESSSQSKDVLSTSTPKVKSESRSKRAQKTKKARKLKAQLGGKHIFNRMRSFRR
jgi:thiol-disulfide isomerase/thioredoxin